METRTKTPEPLAEAPAPQFVPPPRATRSFLSKLGWTQDDTLYLDREGNLHDTSTTGSIYSVSLKGGATASTCPATGSPTSAAYTVVATPINAQLPDTKCGAMCLSSVGIKSAQGSDASDCWTR